MTEHYVTLFDSLFIPQGLALYRSMERNCGDFRLWVLCIDEETLKVLTSLKLDNICLLRLSNFETSGLLNIKAERTRGEYCWTLTPFSVRFVFESDSEIRRVTYIDADTWFTNSPRPIFDEFNYSGCEVLITEHAYSPEHDQSIDSGRFCVQFMTFTREGGEEIRSWWEARCLEWCYARHEDGKFGDQKYLDDWPVRFQGKIHVLRDQSLTMGPWNATRFPYSASVFWHFHGVRLAIQKNRLLLMWGGGYALPIPTRENIYEPYLLELKEVVQVVLREIDYAPRSQKPPSFYIRVAYILRGIWRATWRLRTGVVWR